ncbi:hypothetical protein M407DRAFT_24642 [Tulasnella calospora MUT 4182]|uniref:Uncharacterized protein n=1 Tax=Tulasnella calospora MUT 4182 TaxID=1051891 RepID=A0A0C3QJ24_9AGAM|nr:hypothetical protein M407DRAFT_24642 [Tulasnella calospora MUT 4182]
MDPPASPHADEHTALRRSSVSSATVAPTEPPDKDDNHKSSISESELRITDGNPQGKLLGFLPTVFVLFITLGFAFLIMGWLLVRQYEPIQGGTGLSAAVRNGSFIVYEGGAPAAGQKGTVNLRVLTFSALVSHLISDTSSDGRRNGSFAKSNASAYGLLVRLLGSSSIISIYETGWYAIRPRKRARLPRLFKEAFALAITIWIMSHAVGLADLYLHTVTRSILVDLPARNKGPGSYPYAVAFNETLCAKWGPRGVYPCLVLGDGWSYTFPEVVESGYLAIANRTNSKFQVITLADASDAAIVVPGAGMDLSSTAFTAQTFGARAQCRTLTHECEKLSGRTVNCTQAGYPGLPYFEPFPTVNNNIFGVVDGQQTNVEWGPTSLDSGGFTTNPVNLALQMRWNLHRRYMDSFTAEQADAAVDIVPLPYTTLFAGCNVTFSNITVRYAPMNNSWNILLEEKSSDNFTSVMWAPTISQLGTDRLAAEMMTIAMMEMRPNVTAALNQYLGRMMLGVAVGMFQSAEATDVKQTVPTLLGQYPVGPIMILIALLFLYAVLATLIFTSSWLTNDETIVVLGDKRKDGTPEEQSVLNLTQRWLVDPLPLVAAAFPGEDGKDAQRSVADSAVDMVYDGNGPDTRVSIGFQGKGGFGLRKRGNERFLEA